MATALVTGATGYIGRRLTAELLEDDWDVVALVRPDSNTMGVAAECVVTDGGFASIDAAVAAASPDCVFHLAAGGMGRVEPGDLANLVATNVTFGLHLLESIASREVRALVNVGTYWEYDVDGAFRPNSIYAATKRAFADLLPFYAFHRGLRAVTAVLFDVYGSKDSRAKFLPALIAAVRNGESIPLTGGQQRLDMTHVDDVVAALRVAAELARKRSMPGVDTFAVDSGERPTLREIVAELEAIAGRSIDARWGALEYRRNQVFEPVKTLERMPGWEPQVSLGEGLRRAFET